MHFFKMTLLCLLLPTCMYAQHILVRDENGIIVNNDTLVRIAGVIQKPPYIEIECYLYPQNTSAALLDIGARKREITIGAGVEHSFCFAGVCYSSSVFTSPGGSMTAAGDIDSTFSGHYRFIEGAHTPSLDLVAYTFYDRNNPDDTAVVYVIYNTIPTTGIQGANGHVQPAITASPNPASNTINFHYNGIAHQPLNLIITDPMARISIRQTIHNMNVLSLDISQWPAGNYYYTFYDGDNNISKGSFIVTH